MRLFNHVLFSLLPAPAHLGRAEKGELRSAPFVTVIATVPAQPLAPSSLAPSIVAHLDTSLVHLVIAHLCPNHLHYLHVVDSLPRSLFSVCVYLENASALCAYCDAVMMFCNALITAFTPHYGTTLHKIFKYAVFDQCNIFYATKCKMQLNMCLNITKYLSKKQ